LTVPWPQYHDGTPKQFQYIYAAYWQFQLGTAYRDADGIVLWGPSRFPWDETSGDLRVHAADCFSQASRFGIVIFDRSRHVDSSNPRVVPEAGPGSR
jgi:hypothetical protein